jgi:hypothetical protein
MIYFSLFDVVWVRVKRDMENGVKQVFSRSTLFPEKRPLATTTKEKLSKNFFDSISTSTLPNK